MLTKTKVRKESPAGAFNIEKYEQQERSKSEVDKILSAPRYKHVKVRVLKRDGKSIKRSKKRSKKYKFKNNSK